MGNYCCCLFNNFKKNNKFQDKKNNNLEMAFLSSNPNNAEDDIDTTIRNYLYHNPTYTIKILQESKKLVSDENSIFYINNAFYCFKNASNEELESIYEHVIYMMAGIRVYKDNNKTIMEFLD